MPYLKQKTPTKRILSIVRRLYAMEKLRSSTIADEYAVSVRTIHRDMTRISETIPLVHDFGIWSLDIAALGDEDTYFQKAMLSSFAQNAQIDIACLERSDTSGENITFAIEYSHLPKELGEDIMRAIRLEKRCTFRYTKKEGTTQRVTDPIKVYTENGRWYLIARDYRDDRVKNFNLQKIKQFKITKHNTTLTPAMQAEADHIKSIWSSSGREEVLVRLYVEPSVAHYIKDIKLHKSQTIYDEHHDGGLEVHCTITHKLEILPQIKYWLPRVYVLEPKWLHDEIMGDLEIYSHESDRLDI